VPYPLFEQARLLIEEWQGQVLDEDFAADVTVTAVFTTEAFARFQEALRELSHGRLQAEIVETNPETIMPLGSMPGPAEETT
jgi:putative IMPACT (imprinted ancient) family translation regulator